jgi:hypothetical protein
MLATDQITRIYIDSELKTLYFQYLHRDTSEKVMISQMIGIYNAPHGVRNSYLTKHPQVYPLVYTHNYREEVNRKDPSFQKLFNNSKNKYKTMQEKF